MSPSPQPRVAWITGASTGIGRALARRLAAMGWTVAASARSAGDLASLAAEASGRIVPFVLDVTDETACVATVEAIEAALCPISRAVLNAGSYFPTTAEDFSVDNFRRTVDLNLMGAVNCMGPLAPRMVARRSGQIALMGSQTAYVGLPTAASYGATKAALLSIAEAFKVDFERFGVDIRIINPGFVKTPLTDKNDFPMPFLVPVDKAIDVIVRGLDGHRFNIGFPWQIVALIRCLAALPYPLKFAITRRMIPEKK